VVEKESFGFMVGDAVRIKNLYCNSLSMRNRSTSQKIANGSTVYKELIKLYVDENQFAFSKAFTGIDFQELRGLQQITQMMVDLRKTH
jgi:hypothetical protein